MYFHLQDTKKAVGPVYMMEKNLELQGYNVISVSPYSWNAMHMNVDDAKSDFFRQKFTNFTQPKFPFSASSSTDRYRW